MVLVTFCQSWPTCVFSSCGGPWPSLRPPRSRRRIIRVSTCFASSHRGRETQHFHRGYRPYGAPKRSLRVAFLCCDPLEGLSRFTVNGPPNLPRRAPFQKSIRTSETAHLADHIEPSTLFGPVKSDRPKASHPPQNKSMPAAMSKSCHSAALLYFQIGSSALLFTPVPNS